MNANLDWPGELSVGLLRDLSNPSPYQLGSTGCLHRGSDSPGELSQDRDAYPGNPSEVGPLPGSYFYLVAEPTSIDSVHLSFAVHLSIDLSLA